MTADTINKTVRAMNAQQRFDLAKHLHRIAYARGYLHHPKEDYLDLDQQHALNDAADEIATFLQDTRDAQLGYNQLTAHANAMLDNAGDIEPRTLKVTFTDPTPWPKAICWGLAISFSIALWFLAVMGITEFVASVL